MQEAKDEMESKLLTLKGEYQEVSLVEKEKVMATRYRKIKFFERKKLQRSLLHVTKNLENAGIIVCLCVCICVRVLLCLEHALTSVSWCAQLHTHTPIPMYTRPPCYSFSTS